MGGREAGGGPIFMHNTVFLRNELSLREYSIFEHTKLHDTTVFIFFQTLFFLKFQKF